MDQVNAGRDLARRRREEGKEKEKRRRKPEGRRRPRVKVERKVLIANHGIHNFKNLVINEY